jgi:hypothetical protein
MEIDDPRLLSELTGSGRGSKMAKLDEGDADGEREVSLRSSF